MSTAVSVDEAAGPSGQVTVREYAVADARERWPDWDEISREERARRVRESLTPSQESTTTNVVVDEFLEHVVDLMDQSQGNSAQEVTKFAVGTSTTTPQTSDSSLGNEVFRGDIDNEDDKGKDIDFTGFLDSGEANGNTLEETGLFTGPSSDSSTLMVNHALITSTTKDSTKLVTIDYTIKWRDA